MTASKCDPCVETKTTPNTHTRCEKCGHFRPLKPAELQKVAKRAPKFSNPQGEYGPSRGEPQATADWPPTFGPLAVHWIN